MKTILKTAAPAPRRAPRRRRSRGDAARRPRPGRRDPQRCEGHRLEDEPGGRRVGSGPRPGRPARRGRAGRGRARRGAEDPPAAPPLGAVGRAHGEGRAAGRGGALGPPGAEGGRGGRARRGRARPDLAAPPRPRGRGAAAAGAPRPAHAVAALLAALRGPGRLGRRPLPGRDDRPRATACAPAPGSSPARRCREEGRRTGSRSSGCRGTSPTTRGCAWWPRTTPATPPRSPSWTASSRSRRTATRSFSTTPSSRRWSRRSGRRRRGSRTAGASSRTTSRSTATCARRTREELVALAPRTAGAFLWTEPFLPLRNAKVMSAFADQRTYVYQGKDVDAQTHLGFDLAVVARTPVPGRQPGRRPPRALLRHLRQHRGRGPRARPRDALLPPLLDRRRRRASRWSAGAVLGRTGATGLAGGDHLHFTTLVRGLPVNPVEWWDGAWIRDRVAGKVGPAALAFAGPTSKR